MKKLISLFWLASAFFIFTTIMSSCGTSKEAASKSKNADQLYNSGDYQSALKLYDEIISKYETSGKEKECPVYTKAGESALKSGQIDKAIEYFKKAEYSNFANEDTFTGLADCYKKKDNLSKELLSLLDYVSKYPDGKQINDVKKRLFEIYVESENFDKALNLWPDISESAKSDSNLIIKYFEANKGVDNISACDSLAPVILDFHPKNVEVLEWEAKKYYDKAENLYQKEMKAYEKNRTNKQYKHLLKVLEDITADYKEALKYYEDLYKINPDPKYATYLANIYHRLNNEQKSKYYKQKAGK